MQSKEEIAEVDERGQKERRPGKMEGWSTRGLRAQGFSYSMFSGSCLLQSTRWCIIWVSLPGAIFVPLFCQIWLSFIFSRLFLCLFLPHQCLLLSFLFTSPPPFYLLCPPPFHFIPLCSLIIFRGRTVKPFNRSEEVLEVWWKLPLSKSPAENHSTVWSSLSMRQADFISTVLNLPALLPNCLNEPVPRFTSTGLSLVRLIWEYECS